MPAEQNPSQPPTLPPTPSSILKCSLCGSRILNSILVAVSAGECMGELEETSSGERVCLSCADSLGMAANSRTNGETAERTTAPRTMDSLHVETMLVSAEHQDVKESGIPEALTMSSLATAMPCQSPAQLAPAWTNVQKSALELLKAPLPSYGAAAHETVGEEQWSASKHLSLWPVPASIPRSWLNPVEESHDYSLSMTAVRAPCIGRGDLYPGSVFKGSQTSGRSSYEVEIRILDVNFAQSTLSGYLSISHLTESHPHLMTYFDGEIIGIRHGFVTGPRYSATMHDDLRHWGRFEQFRRPSTRSDLVGEELFLRDPVDQKTGQTLQREFVFLRIKERFLVPDHKVKDISGASFAGFYYAMVDFSPRLAPSSPPKSPGSPKSPTSSSTSVPRSPRISSTQETSTSPAFPRQQTATERDEVRQARSTAPKLAQNRRSSKKEDNEGRGESTIRGYYFHSLNQEPFQELFLTHVPEKSSSTFEYR
ncbi:uncharacterized protein L203_102370 [Cryptococcus depauperatus CBS 7841]|uniref:Uncharacterized protein n=1 Tax=Cryptococcus depauperatus CBS 7841 TaxID=1295531 RepID=A0AAJ8M0L9_9TREE